MDSDDSQDYDEYDAVAEAFDPSGPAPAKPTASKKKKNRPEPEPEPVAPTPPSAAANDDTQNEEPRDSFITSEAVVNRIRWDSSINPAEMSVAYEDRFATDLRIVSYESFMDRRAAAGTITIPFHRVRTIFRGDEAVWCRDRRIYTLGAKDIPKPAGGTGSGSRGSPFSKAKGKQLDIVAPTGGAGKAVVDVGSTLRVLNFNVLHDMFDSHLIFTPQRLPLVAQLISQCDADITMLQEATPEFVEALFRLSPTLNATQYRTTIPKGENTIQMTLSKHRITHATSVVTSGRKRCVLAAIETPQAGTVLTGNCHLLSDFGNDAVARRTREYGTIVHHLNVAADATMRRSGSSGAPPLRLISGDFNFGDQNAEHAAFDWAGYSDSWLVAHGIDPAAVEQEMVLGTVTPTKLSPIGGFTYDPQRNWLADVMSKFRKYPRRLDRTLYAGMTGVKAVSVELVGRAPDVNTQVPVGEQGVLTPLPPSDHYGLLTTLAIDRTAPDAPAANVAQRKKAEAAALVAPATLCPPAEVIARFPRLESAKPHFRSALVFLLPKQLWPVVNEVRRTRDKAFPRWMPHATILFPFVPEADLPAAATLLQDAFAAAPRGSLPNPFSIRIRPKVQHFGGNKAVLYLAPDTAGGGREFSAVFSYVSQLFPSMVRNDRKEYVPHFTLGQCASSQVSKESTAIENVLTPSLDGDAEAFTVSQVHVICHLDGKEAYEVVASIDLPPAA